MVLAQKPNFSLAKTWLGKSSKTNFFLGQGWFWREKPIFCQEKDGFGVLFPRQKMVLGGKPIFSREDQKTIILDFGRIVYQKMFFCFSLGKSWFSFPKPSFPKKKLVFYAKTIFIQGKTKKHLFGVWPHSVSKRLFFLFFFGFP